MKVILYIALTVFTILDCFSQKLNIEYYFISNDSLLVDHYLTFKNDSIVQISSIPRHMWQPMSKNLKYEKVNERLIINSADSLLLEKYGFICDKELIVVDRALIDENKKELYVIRKDFEKSPDIIVKFDGKEYKIDCGESNSYGLVTKSPKRNRILQRKLKTVNLDEYEINLLKGYEAYKKYGYDYVFGVIEMKRK